MRTLWIPETSICKDRTMVYNFVEKQWVPDCWLWMSQYETIMKILDFGTEKFPANIAHLSKGVATDEEKAALELVKSKFEKRWRQVIAKLKEWQTKTWKTLEVSAVSRPCSDFMGDFTNDLETGENSDSVTDNSSHDTSETDPSLETVGGGIDDTTEQFDYYCKNQM